MRDFMLINLKIRFKHFTTIPKEPRVPKNELTNTDQQLKEETSVFKKQGWEICSDIHLENITHKECGNIHIYIAK